MSFTWIFAIIAGVIIIFLAIYGVSKIIDTGKNIKYTEAAAEIIALLNPFESGLSSGKSAELDFKKQAEIYFQCAAFPLPFGKQKLAFSQEDLGKDKTGEAVSFNNYVFADNLKSKKLYVFSKSFNLGIKVTDLLIITDKNYCFKLAPNRIKEDIEKLGLTNIKLDICEENDVNVCFGSYDCDINVIGQCNDMDCEDKYEYGFVFKNNEKLYFVDSLLYGAIVSPLELYECNVKRLMGKTSQLAGVYIDKINIVKDKGCSSDMQGDLNSMIAQANSLNSSSQLVSLYNIGKNINNKNENAICKIY